jgi:hypothetical protein
VCPQERIITMEDLLESATEELDKEQANFAPSYYL